MHSHKAVLPSCSTHASVDRSYHPPLVPSPQKRAINSLAAEVSDRCVFRSRDAQDASSLDARGVNPWDLTSRGLVPRVARELAADVHSRASVPGVDGRAKDTPQGRPHGLRVSRRGRKRSSSHVTPPTLLFATLRPRRTLGIPHLSLRRHRGFSAVTATSPAGRAGGHSRRPSPHGAGTKGPGVLRQHPGRPLRAAPPALLPPRRAAIVRPRCPQRGLCRR